MRSSLKLASELYHLGRVNDAFALLTSPPVQAAGQPDADYHLLHGRLLVRLGRYKEAARVFQQAAERFPDRPECKDCLMSLSQLEKNWLTRTLLFFGRNVASLLMLLLVCAMLAGAATLITVRVQKLNALNAKVQDLGAMLQSNQQLSLQREEQHQRELVSWQRAWQSSLDSHRDSLLCSLQEQNRELQNRWKQLSEEQDQVSSVLLVRLQEQQQEMEDLGQSLQSLEAWSQSSAQQMQGLDSLLRVVAASQHQADADSGKGSSR